MRFIRTAISALTRYSASAIGAILIGLALVIASAMPAAAQHSNTVSWQPGVGGGTVTGYNVKRSLVSGGPYTTVGTTTTALSYVDTLSLVEGTTYFFVVTATGPGGESAPSNEAKGTIPFSVPSNPSNTTVVSK